MTSIRGKCVFKNKDSSGHVQKVYVMYHGTSAASAISIMKFGFRPSTPENTVWGMILGQGVYVSRDLSKAMGYGKVVLKLLVYTGLTCQITTDSVLLRFTWQKSFDSAWIPPHCGVVPSGLEENCVKDPSHILVLGVVRGEHLCREGAGFQSFSDVHKLLPNEQEYLSRFIEKLRLGYFYLKNISTGKFLCVETESWSRRCSLVETVNSINCTCHALWCWLGDTTLPDMNCGHSGERTGSFSSKLSGRILTVKTREEGVSAGEVTCYMADYGINYPIWTNNTKRCQLFTSGASGELLHRASEQFLTITRDVNNNQGWVGLGHGRDYWEFVHCGMCPVCDRNEGEVQRCDPKHGTVSHMMEPVEVK